MKSNYSRLVVLIILLLAVVGLSFFFKYMTMRDVYKQPNFKGVVIQVYDESILVSVSEDADELKSSDIMSVSLNAKNKDSVTEFSVGDKVTVYYDGTIAESYPAQINNVYAIFLD